MPRFAMSTYSKGKDGDRFGALRSRDLHRIHPTYKSSPILLEHSHNRSSGPFRRIHINDQHLMRPNRRHAHLMHLRAQKRGILANAAVTGNPCESPTRLYNAWAYPFKNPKRRS